MRSAPAHLDIRQDVVSLLTDLVNFPSESRNEAAIADAVERALGECSHLEVLRSGNTVIARTQLGRPQRVVIGGHLDTVPSSGNDRAVIVKQGDTVPVAAVDGSMIATEDRLYGLGSCDMKGGVAVSLRLAAELTEPTRDVTYVYYDCEEIEADFNGLKRVAEQHPEWIAGDFAVLMEPSDAGIEAGCQGTMRIEIALDGRRAHTARAWMGTNAIHRAAAVLEILDSYQPRRVVIDGLEYREGLQAVGIHGGVAGNVVPDACVVTINHRFAPDRDVAAAETHLRDVFAGFEVTVIDAIAGALPGLSQPAAKAFVEAIGAHPNPKFGWTDVARFSALGIPAVNFGPASPTLAHAPNEYVPIAHLASVEAGLRKWLTD